jgi:putative tryptophan/tyrosine transport system substrate-binding protein
MKHHEQSADRVARVTKALWRRLLAGPDDPIFAELRLGLRERGYVDGENIRIEYHSARGRIERLPAVLQELVELKVDVIVAGAEPIVRAAKQATSTIPIVMVGRDREGC